MEGLELKISGPTGDEEFMQRALNDKLLSVIVPVFNEESVINEMVSVLHNCLDGKAFNYEIIIVNDGSFDETLQKTKILCEEDNRVKLISFSKNFGHQIAVTAGS